MSTNTQEKYEAYYVPEQSKLPIFSCISLAMTVFGAAAMINSFSAGGDGGVGKIVCIAGLVLLLLNMYVWFSTVIKENIAGLNSAQLKRSFVWGMGWFIFSEVMFFAAFFGALYYVACLSAPWLGGEGDKGLANMLWEGFQYQWPLMVTPDQAVNGDSAQFIGPQKYIGAIGLPLVNTALLLASSVTLTFAHHALKDGNRNALKTWMYITVACGIVFLYCQGLEYSHAYHDGLTLQSGVFGTTFFMLTGFHGFHVTIGTIMLIVMTLRIQKGHFTKDDHFGFEGAAWYWHFVDVVWILLFIFVYVIPDWDNIF